jgi:DNA-binding response OmpR family regulator
MSPLSNSPAVPKIMARDFTLHSTEPKAVLKEIRTPGEDVLLVTADRSLGQTRSLILRQSGCSVVVAMYEQARQFACIEPFSVALICQSIPAGRAVSFAGELRRYSPGIRILRIALCPEGSEAGFDRALSAPVEPSALQQAVLCTEQCALQ